MSESLNSFLKHRLREIEELEASLRARLQTLAEERDQLDRAAVAAGIEVTELRETVAPLSGRRKVVSRMTIKDAVVELLSERGHGMAASDLLPLVNQRLGVEYPRSSLSPQLSRLKKHRILKQEGNLWCLNQSTSDENPVDPLPPGVSGQRVFSNPARKAVKPGPGGGA